MSHFDCAAAAKAQVLHAVIWHSHPFPPIHTWCISSLIKAVCCDAFNINHIQCAGRTQSSVYQLESAHASGAGYVLLRSIISLKSYRLIV